jgi:hypothetical protein
MHVRGRTDKDSCWRDSGLAGIAVSWAALPLICAMYAQAQSKPTGVGIDRHGDRTFDLPLNH